MTTVHYIVVFVLRPAGGSYELLMGRRSEGRYLGGTWQLITGGIEPCETAWQAALREVAEETGLRALELYRLSHLTQFCRADTDQICVAPMFAALVAGDSEVVMDSEHEVLEWVAVESASERLMWPGDRLALEQVRAEILMPGPAKRYLRVRIPDVESHQC